MNKKLNFYILCTVVFLQGLVFYGPFSVVYRVSRGLSMYEIFIIESIFMILMLIFEVPWGWFADRFGYKKTLIIANFILFVSKIVFYEAGSFFLFLAERVLMALAYSGISGCDIALLYSSVDSDKSEKYLGIYTACSSAGLLVACLLSGVMAVNSIDSTAFYTIIPYGAAAVLIFFIKDVQYNAEEKPSIKGSIRDVLRNGRLLLLVVSSALVGEVSHSIGVFLNQPQYTKSGIGIGYFGILTAFMQVVCLVSAKVHKLTGKFGTRKVIKALNFSILASSILLAFTRNPIISIALIALSQGSFACLQPVVLSIENKSILLQNRATILSIYAMVGDIVSSLVNFSIGRYADISVEAAFLVCGIISAAGCILVFLYFSKAFRKKALEVNSQVDAFI